MGEGLDRPSLVPFADLAADTSRTVNLDSSRWAISTRRAGASLPPGRCRCEGQAHVSSCRGAGRRRHHPRRRVDIPPRLDVNVELLHRLPDVWSADFPPADSHRVLAASCGGGGGGGGGSAAEGDQVDSVEGVESRMSATVQIVVTNSFIDPEVGLQMYVAGKGSGFIIDPAGIAVTDGSVVAGAATLEVSIPGQERPRNAVVLSAAL